MPLAYIDWMANRAKWHVGILRLQPDPDAFSSTRRIISMLPLISTWSVMFCSRTNDVHSVQNCTLDVLVRDMPHIETRAEVRTYDRKRKVIKLWSKRSKSKPEIKFNLHSKFCRNLRNVKIHYYSYSGVSAANSAFKRIILDGHWLSSLFFSYWSFDIRAI